MGNSSGRKAVANKKIHEGRRASMRRERFDKINVVPFIDIVLVLLVIVLATASFINKKSVKVDLPTASSKTVTEKKAIMISIDKEGKYFYEKTELSLENLKERLKKLDPKKDVISLQTDQKTEFQKFVSIIDILKEKGFQNLSIITK
jgi:biopolymer transport protein ExbD